jgi:uroporphyrinogen decarboxylase
MFDDVFKPRYQRMWSLVKEKAPHLKICLHSCGSIFDLLPSLIEAGLDSFNPVQTTCYHMEPKRLKDKFGEKITFWGGGCDTQKVLSQGTTKDVEENVKENIEILKKDGGFIFQQVHNILADVPPENIVAMFEAAKKYGVY